MESKNSWPLKRVLPRLLQKPGSVRYYRCLIRRKAHDHHHHTGRGDRMKAAKVEAQGLIDGYRSEKQEEFNNMALSKGGSEGSASAKLQADTNKEIQEMQSLFQKNAQKAVDVLLSKCCEVSLEVPTARVRATQKAAGVVQ